MDCVFNLPKYLKWFCSLGIGSVKNIIDYFNLKGYSQLGLVPGLLKAASFITKSDSVLVEGTIEKFLRKKTDQLALQRTIISIAIDQVKKYSLNFLGDPIPDDFLYLEFEGKDRVSIAHSMIWTKLLRDDVLRDAFLFH